MTMRRARRLYRNRFSKLTDSPIEGNENLVRVWDEPRPSFRVWVRTELKKTWMDVFSSQKMRRIVRG